jgi:LysM repeat protein
MQKNKKICFCITPGRMMGAVLLAASIVNLIIVGAAFELTFPDPVPTITVTATQMALTATGTPSASTVAPGYLFTATVEPTGTPTPTFPLTPTATLTSTPTNTSTPTATPLPPPTQCTARFYWQVYRVQQGDTLYSLAIVTGSSVEELMKANCLSNTLIYRGQQLYVPQLPIPPTATSAQPVTDLPNPAVITPAANSQTGVRSSFVCYRIGEAKVAITYMIQFSVALFDPEGINSVIVEYQVNDGSPGKAEMSPSGTFYVANGPLSNIYGRNDVVRYSYHVTDSTGNTTVPFEDKTDLVSCSP